MDIYVARQPIFDRNQKVIGYELLTPSGPIYGNDAADETEASLAVIRNTFLFLAEQIVTPPHKAFIRVTRALLINGVARSIPNQSTVIEIAEYTELDDEVLNACRELKEVGYLLALTGCAADNTMQNPLLDLADIVKVDVTKATAEETRSIVEGLAHGHRKLLAEKVETRDALKAALAVGYTFFQGSFFAKPVIVQGHDMPGYKRNYLKILRELSRRELDFQALERVIKQDVTLCYTLLKYINSPYFGLRDEVTSILRAIVLLGEKEVRRWASLVLLTLMGPDEPPEVVVRSLIRGRMCELLAEDVGLKGHKSDLFLMGMFSMLHVLIGRPLGEILKGLSLDRGVKEALLGKENEYRRLYDLVVTYESGEWEQCFAHATKLQLDTRRISKIFITAAAYADQVARVGRDQSEEHDSRTVRTETA
ncbi:MAG: hypothetical protein H6Q55_136 [Deltaproteobacteria bacterium]|nr:hypothetical protein [Deltaproteobacteria bacterium]